MQYFTRHGHCSHDSLTATGRKNLHSVKKQLDSLGFNPVSVLTSPANRCVETAHILAPDCTVETNEELRAFADYRSFVESDGQAPLDTPEKWNFSNWEKVLDLVLTKKPSLIVGHDSNSVILAFKLLEQRGITISWGNQPEHLTMLSMGHGILVDGTQYKHIAP